MAPEWIGVVGVLSGVAAAGGLGFIQDAFAEKRRQRSDLDARRHATEEARYEARRNAYVTFAAVLYGAIEGVHEYAYDHQGEYPGDHGHEVGHGNVYEAFTLVRIIGPDEAVEAAEAANMALNAWAFSNGTEVEVNRTAEQFVQVSRRLLKFEIT